MVPRDPRPRSHGRHQLSGRCTGPDGGGGVGGNSIVAPKTMKAERIPRSSSSSNSSLGGGSGRGSRNTCLQRCLSRLTVLASLLSLGLLAASVATDRWIYTTEPLQQLNATPRDTAYTITFQSGLWRTCSTVNWTNASTSMRVTHAYAKCTPIPLWMTDMTSSMWKEADFTGSFLSDMRFSTPFIAIGVVFVGLAVLTSLIGHCLQDFSTLVAAVFLILAGLTLGGGLVIYMTSLSTVYNEQAYYRKSIVDVRLYYHYGPSFYGACLALIVEELSALVGIVAYLSHFRSNDELLKLIPGVQRRLGETRRRRNYIKMSKTDSSMTMAKADSRRTLKEDLTTETLTQIECVTVAL